MTILGWNCRGLGHVSAVPCLKNLIRTYKPEAIFLYETLVHASKVEEVRRRIGFDGCFVVDREGRGGGVAILWRNTFKCEITDYYLHINVEVEDEDRGRWRITGFYGYPKRTRRRESWALLRRLAGLSNHPWCIIRDFNDLLSHDEKKGRCNHPNYLMMGFREAIHDAKLIDIELEGYPFTWRYAMGMERAIAHKLDRAMANNQWLQIFPQARLLNLISSKSDHSPLLLQCELIMSEVNSSCFRFENIWLLENDLADVVHEGWSMDVEDDMVRRLGGCASKLQRWGRRIRTKFKSEIDDCRRLLESLRDRRDEAGAQQYTFKKDHMTNQITKEDLIWRQRAKMFWLKDGDFNTRFFHASATCRSKVNKITKLMGVNNIVTEDPVQIKQVAYDYFQQLFLQKNSNYDPALNVIPATIRADDNNMLLTPFTREEFYMALMQMNSDKALGPDGFIPAFYKRFWEDYGEEIFNACSLWLDRGYFPSSINGTNIALIPKNESPSSMKDWRPITLCNVIYKLVLKVLANLLKIVLHKCVSAVQSAFVPGRSILDNAMLAVEIIHFLKNKTQGRKGDVALKIDE